MPCWKNDLYIKNGATHSQEQPVLPDKGWTYPQRSRYRRRSAHLWQQKHSPYVREILRIQITLTTRNISAAESNRPFRDVKRSYSHWSMALSAFQRRVQWLKSFCPALLQRVCTKKHNGKYIHLYNPNDYKRIYTLSLNIITFIEWILWSWMWLTVNLRSQTHDFSNALPLSYRNTTYITPITHLTFGTTAPKSPDSGALKVSAVPEASVVLDINTGSSWFTVCTSGTTESTSSGETSKTRLSPVTEETKEWC